MPKTPKSTKILIGLLVFVIPVVIFGIISTSGITMTSLVGIISIILVVVFLVKIMKRWDTTARLAKNVCPHCGYEGAAQIKTEGNMGIGILLLLLGAIPGILYFLFFVKNRYLCSKCGTEIEKI